MDPLVNIRVEQGFIPYIPQKLAGILILPPISDPIPTNEHLLDIMPPSP